ncbi:hypothetical protein F5Y08DRAFT_312965 [Xylaria arbuscula]|nr:hypothetical protein F5Y08DRAFT_312965 [Xylaria arbuscula]
MPVAPHAAVIPGKYYHVAYTEVINLLNYSAVVIPVTKADKQIDVVDDSYCPSGDLDQMNWDACEFICDLQVPSPRAKQNPGFTATP